MWTPISRLALGRRVVSLLHPRPAISVVVPVFRTEPYLADCLASILRQSLRDIQVIVVDDGSPGAVRQIVQRLSAQDHRVTLVRHRANQGTLAARLSGARAARAPYLAFVDGDDIVDEHFLATMHDAARSHDADLVQCGISMIAFDQTRSLLNVGGSAHLASGDSVLAEFLDGKMSNSVANKLIRTACWRRAAACLGHGVGRVSFGEDLLMTFFVTFLAKRYAHIPDPLYVYVRRQESATLADGDSALEQREAAMREVWRAIAPMLERCQQPDDLKRHFLQREFWPLVPDARVTNVAR